MISKKTLILLTALGITLQSHAELTSTAVASTATAKAATLGAFLKSTAVAIQTACQAHPFVAAATGVTVVVVVSYNYYNRPIPVSSNISDIKFVTYIPGQPNDPLARRWSHKEIAAHIKGGARLAGAYADIPNTNIAVSTELPKNQKLVHVLFTPVICSADPNTWDRSPFDAYKSYEVGVTKDAATVTYSSQNYDRRSINFGQEQDQLMYDTVLEQVAKLNPDAKIVPMGICASGTALLNTLANKNLCKKSKKQIHTVVLQSPGISYDDVMKNMGNSYLPTGFKWLFPALAKKYFVNCAADKTNEEILASYENIPAHIAFNVAKITHDKVTSRQSIDAIIGKLQQNKNGVDTFECSDEKIEHGHLAPNKVYQEFLKVSLGKDRLS